MDLVPTPGQLVSAAGNLARGLLGGHFADLTPMARALVDKGDRRSVHEYHAVADLHGDPVLLVSPLVAPASCYDLRRGGSLVEHLVATGRRTFLVEYGDLSPDAPDALAHVVRQALPAAVRAVSTRSGGRPVHLVGWSLGGIAAMLAAADGSLPLASLVVAGAPVDAAKVPLSASTRSLVSLPIPGVVTRAVGLLGGLPDDLAPLLAPAMVVRQLVDRPIAQVVNLDDADFLAQVEAVAAFQESLRVPGRSYGRLYHRFLRDNALVDGRLEVDGTDVRLADVDVPVLVIAGADDVIAPVASVSAAAPLLTGSPDVRVEVVPGGHLGLLTGRRARSATWPVLDRWFAGLDEAEQSPVRKPSVRSVKKAAAKKTPARKAPAKEAVAKKTPARKAPAKKAAAKKAPAKKAPARKAPVKKAATDNTIGANPSRRYGSAGSRALRR